MTLRPGCKFTLLDQDFEVLAVKRVDEYILLRLKAADTDETITIPDDMVFYGYRQGYVSWDKEQIVRSLVLHHESYEGARLDMTRIQVECGLGYKDMPRPQEVVDDIKYDKRDENEEES